MQWKVAGTVAMVVGTLCAVAFAWEGYRLVGILDPRFPIGNPISYPDFIAVLLTGVTVLLATLGIVVAIAAFWGYREITAKAKTAAGSAARAYFRSKQGQVLLRGLVETAIEQADMKRMSEADRIPEGFSEHELSLSKDRSTNGEVDAYPEKGGDQK